MLYNVLYYSPYDYNVCMLIVTVYTFATVYVRAWLQFMYAHCYSLCKCVTLITQHVYFNATFMISTVQW